MLSAANGIGPRMSLFPMYTDAFLSTVHCGKVPAHAPMLHASQSGHSNELLEHVHLLAHCCQPLSWVHADDALAGASILTCKGACMPGFTLPDTAACSPVILLAQTLNVCSSVRFS